MDHKVIVLNSHGVGQFCRIKRLPVLGESLRAWDWHIPNDGGKGSNVSVALGRLGINTAIVTKVGNDAWGDLGEKWMSDAGVDCSFLYRSDDVSTGTGLVMIDDEGNNTIIDGEGSGRFLTPEEVIGAIDGIAGATHLITGFEIPEKLAILGLKHAKEKGMITVLNPSPLPEEDYDDLSFVDYLFVNELEGRTLLHEDEDIDDETILRELHEHLGVKTTVMTLGKNGYCFLEDGRYVVKPGIKVDNVKTTAGAGDGFLAATMAQLIKGKSLDEACDWAQYYAALSITYPDTMPGYRYPEEVEAFKKKYLP
jgi:ribokinase